MVIVHSYVSLPEGIHGHGMLWNVVFNRDRSEEGDILTFHLQPDTRREIKDNHTSFALKTPASCHMDSWFFL